MIVGSLQEVIQQCTASPSMRKAFDFLLEMCDQDPPDGIVEIDGTKVYAIVQSYDSDPATNVIKFEAHRRYIDIQYLVSGKEIMGWAHLEKLMTTIPYNETKDALYGVVSPDRTTLIHYEAGHAVVLFPTDAHSPGLADGVSEAVKKIVVKVAVTAD